MAIDNAEKVRLTLLLSRDEAAEVDEYRRQASRIPSASRALAELVRMALQAWREKEQKR